jgi:6-phosphogluconolactonase/glucosamine-6-phosphate isomerase/deaminase
VLEIDDRRVALTETAYQGHRRMTLTYPALAEARQIVWLITGADKVDALTKLIAGDTSIPAGTVENPNMTVVADAAAAR